ncbi:MAG: hypothetical protein ACOZHQ_09225 [Thermodesulfobacteriota bacterium]
MPLPATIAERDDELRRLLLELDQLETRRTAIQRRLKLLVGLGDKKKTRSRTSQADLDAWARGGPR